MLRNTAQTLPLPAQVLNGLSTHQGWAWKCAVSHLHIPIWLRNPCTYTACASRALTHAQTPQWSHMPPPTLVWRVWTPGNLVSGTQKCLFLCSCINCVRSPVSRHNLIKQDLHPQLPPPHILDLVTQMHTHVCVCSTAVPLSSSAFMCLHVCVHRQGVHTFSVQSREHTSGCVCLCADTRTCQRKPRCPARHGAGWQR